MTTINYNRLSKEAGSPLLIGGGAILAYLASKKIKDLIRDLPNKQLSRDIVIAPDNIPLSIKSAASGNNGFFRRLLSWLRLSSAVRQRRWDAWRAERAAAQAQQQAALQELQNRGYISSPGTGVGRAVGKVLRGTGEVVNTIDKIPDILFRNGTLKRLVGRFLLWPWKSVWDFGKGTANFIKNTGRQINIGLYGPEQVLAAELAKERYRAAHPGIFKRMQQWFQRNRWFNRPSSEVFTINDVRQLNSGTPGDVSQLNRGTPGDVPGGIPAGFLFDQLNKNSGYNPFMRKKANFRSKYKYDNYVDNDIDAYLYKKAIAMYPYLYKSADLDLSNVLGEVSTSDPFINTAPGYQQPANATPQINPEVLAEQAAFRAAEAEAAKIPWYHPRAIARNAKNFGKTLLSHVKANPLMGLMAGATLVGVPLQLAETVDMIRHPALYYGPHSFSTI